MASVDSRAFLQKLEQCPWLGPKRPPKRAETARCHFSWSRRQPKMFQTLRKQSPMMASVDSRAFLQMLEPCPWSGKKRPPKSAETARCHFYWSRSQPKMFQTLRKQSPMMASVDSRAFLQKLEPCPWSGQKSPPKGLKRPVATFLGAVVSKKCFKLSENILQ